MNQYKNFSVILLKDILSSFNVLLNKMRSTKNHLDGIEKESLKKLAISENNVFKAEQGLTKAKRDDSNATKEYEKATTSHKDPTKAMEKMSSTGSEVSEMTLHLQQMKMFLKEAQLVRLEELTVIVNEADELEDSRLLNYKELLTRLASAASSLYQLCEKSDSVSNIMANQINADTDCKELKTNLHWKY